MRKLKENIVPTFIVGTTLVLALVAVFTATRLYQLRNNSVEQSKAWDCSRYVFNVGESGIVSVKNSSSRSESDQQAKVYINGAQVSTLAVPALASGQETQIGTVSVPSEGFFSWEVVGTKDCQNSGSYQLSQISCSAFTFSLTGGSPSPSPTPGGIVANCSKVKIYDTNWTELSVTDLVDLVEGDKIRITVSGATDSGSFDKARFTINGTLQAAVTTKRSGTDEFYEEYTIPADTYSFEFGGEVHHKELDIWI